MYQTQQIIENYISEIGLSLGEVFSEEKETWEWATGITKFKVKISNNDSLQIYVPIIANPEQLTDELYEALFEAEDTNEGIKFKITEGFVYMLREKPQNEVSSESFKQDIEDMISWRENLPKELKDFILQLRDNTITIFSDPEICKSELEEYSYIGYTYDKEAKEAADVELPEVVHSVVDDEIDEHYLDILGKHFPNIQVLKKVKGQNAEPLHLPPSLANLKYLQVLEIDIEHLASIPDFLFEYEYLLSLDLSSIYSNSTIKTISENLGNLKHLQSLSLDNLAEITEIPESIAELQNLRYLYIVDCPKLTKIPEGIAKLQNLQELNIDNCPQISEVPTEIAHLPNLTSLSLCGNNISDLASDFHNMSHISFEKIALSDNPINIEAEKAKNLVEAEEKTQNELRISLHNETAYQKPVEKLITDNEYESIYVGTGVRPAEHPLKDKINFVKVCPNCQSNHIHITYAKHQVHIYSGDEYYDYQGQCQNCGEKIKKSYSEN